MSAWGCNVETNPLLHKKQVLSSRVFGKMHRSMAHLLQTHLIVDPSLNPIVSAIVVPHLKLRTHPCRIRIATGPSSGSSQIRHVTM